MRKFVKATPVVSRQDAYQRGFARWASGEDEAYSKFLQKGGHTPTTFPRQDWYAHLQREERETEWFNFWLMMILIAGFFAYHLLFTGGHF